MDILKQFDVNRRPKNYIFARVTDVSGIKITVETASGLQLSISEKEAVYNVGDQLVLGKNESLDSIFIIRKVNNVFPASGGHIIIS